MNDKELEELLRLAQMGLKPTTATTNDAYSEPTQISEEGLNEAQRFIAAFDLRKGKNKVPLHTTYECYRLWAKEPISKARFLAQFGLLFIPKRTDQYRFYHLNYHPKTLMDKATRIAVEREKVKKS